MKFTSSISTRTINKEKEIRRKTFVLGLLIVLLLSSVVFFGIPLLIRFSVFLGDRKEGISINTSNDDVLPPLAPRIFVPFEATNSAAINISGTAERGTLIELVKNDVLLDTINANDDGDFSFENILLDNGDNSFSAVAVSPEGKRSDLSKEVIVMFDDKKPFLEISNPSEESLTVDYEDFDIIGRTESSASVLVNGRVAMVDTQGNFKIKLQLSLGKNGIEIKTKDLAGNETVKSITITYDF